ncbi:ankyrin repeat-containing protein BDA1-like [Quercus robur]|uniref:ankyrin repeat-containing protein BDA1-like n=1 Tax=Quercus robur TaxID=38942 RepID=UPI002161ACC6|nr:ankyrin repeat-containing protein BDA1-like [Quercus robur]
MLHSAGALSGVSLFSNTQSDDNNIDEFYNLIGEDVQLLEHIEELPFVNTPLHIAASYGNIQFALEMMSLKPSFARKLNQNGFSPIHLALRNKYTKLVGWLLQIDGDLVRVKGRERLTPLHYVVENDEYLNLLDKFLLFCPDSITDMTVRNETALHIALKYNRLEAFQFLVGWLANNSSKNAEFNERKFLNWQDNEGNTVLHILVSKNQTKAVRHFLSRCKEFVEVNCKNLVDKTAWDMLQEGNTQIRDMLRRAGAKPGSSLSTFNGCPNPEYQRLSPVFMFKSLRREIRNFTVEWRNMLLVVAVLLATLSYQAVLTPPGGVWQDNGLCITTEPGSSYHQFSPSNFFKKIPPSNKTVGSSNYPKIIYLSQSNTTLACEHKAGTAIALEDRLFPLFLICNTALFSFSNSLIILLILHFHVKILFLELTIFLYLSYSYSVWTITDDPSLTLAYMSGAVLHFVFIQLLSPSPCNDHT